MGWARSEDNCGDTVGAKTVLLFDLIVHIQLKDIPLAFHGVMIKTTAMLQEVSRDIP